MATSSGFTEKEKVVVPDDGTPSDRSQDEEFTSINEKALLRKLDRKLLPAVSLLYLLSFLDRSNGICELIQRLGTSAENAQWPTRGSRVSRPTST